MWTHEGFSVKKTVTLELYAIPVLSHLDLKSSQLTIGRVFFLEKSECTLNITGRKEKKTEGADSDPDDNARLTNQSVNIGNNFVRLKCTLVGRWCGRSHCGVTTVVRMGTP